MDWDEKTVNEVCRRLREMDGHGRTAESMASDLEQAMLAPRQRSFTRIWLDFEKRMLVPQMIANLETYPPAVPDRDLIHLLRNLHEASLRVRSGEDPTGGDLVHALASRLVRWSGWPRTLDMLVREGYATEAHEINELRQDMLAALLARFEDA